MRATIRGGVRVCQSYKMELANIEKARLNKILTSLVTARDTVGILATKTAESATMGGVGCSGSANVSGTSGVGPTATKKRHYNGVVRGKDVVKVVNEGGELGEDPSAETQRAYNSSVGSTGTVGKET